VDTILAGQDQQIALGQATALQARMAQRIWLDATYSRLSSDGKDVFCIEEDSAWERSTPAGMPPILIIRQRMKEGRSGSLGNRLAAYDIRTGKLQWEVGGPEDQEYVLPMAGTAFLGPPLPLMGQLYVLGETRNDIRLLVLEARTGRLIWSQQLGVVGQNGGMGGDFDGQPFTSRFLGLSPSYAEGILVCPTGQGALVALDLASRTFLWAYAYLPEMEARDRRMLLIQRMMAFGGQMAPAPWEGWMENTCLLVEGRVLFTTPESRDIYCLNLTDGKELWKQTCPDGLYLACVHDGKVVWVGRHRVGAFRLADGQPAWKVPAASSAVAAADPTTVSHAPAVELPEGAVPSGLGFLSGNTYYLPLSTGEVAALDLTKAEIVHRSKSRTEASPGNLICIRDRVISQNPSGVELYDQTEPLKAQTEARLAQNPEDAEALAIRGEILLDEGRRAEAIESFQRSLARRPDLRTREFLREAIFEGLREDFAAYRRYTPELEKLLDTEEHHAQMERLLADGLLQTREYASAWQIYERLLERKEGRNRLDWISKSYGVRRDRWLQQQWGQLRQKAPAELVHQMDRRIQEQLEEVLQSPDPIGGLVPFLHLYGEHPIGEQARRELVSRLISGGRWLDAELLLREQARSEDSAKKRSATAQLADLLRRAGRPAEAAAYYQQLAVQWPDVVCQEGKTGRQIVQALPPDDPVRRALEPISWPTGRVQVQKSPLPANTSAQSIPYHGRFLLSMENVSDPIWGDIRIVFDQNRRMLLGYDRFGRELWKPFPLSFGNNPNRFFGFNRAWWRVYLQGHLMVLSTGTHLLAYDLLGVSGGESPRLLWSQDLQEPGRLNGKEEGIVLAAFPVMQWRQMPPRPGMAAIGPVSDRIVCFQRLRHLTAVDALTGQTLWVRSDLPAGCELFGDEQRLFVLPPDRSDVLVLRTLDGQMLGKRPLPKLATGSSAPPGGAPAGQAFPPGIVPVQAFANGPVIFGQMLRQYCLASSGSRLLLWSPENDHQSLRLYDLGEEKMVWGPMRFDLNTRPSLIEKEAVGLLEPNGQFTLLRIEDGRVLVKDNLEIGQMSLQGLHLMRFGDQYYVILSGIPPGFQHMPQQPIPGMYVGQVPFGRVYAYTKEGKRAWPKPLELQQQNILFNQPSGVPVLIFATQLFERRGQGGTFHVHLLAIDKQTGRKILEEKFPYTTNIFQITGDPEKHTVDILLQRDKITLTFTDEPWPAEQPAESTSVEPKPRVKKTVTLPNALWRSFQKALLPDRDHSEEQPLPVLPRAPMPVPVIPEDPQ